MQKKKILNFDTTLRDPERIQNYLKILKNYENQILDYDTIIDFFITIISQKLYIPQALYKKYPEFRFKDILSRQEAELIMEEFPQKHGAGGWKAKNEGWGGRFYQSFSTSNQLGFIHTEKGEKIIFSESGERLVTLNDEERGKIYGIFVNALAKFNSNNPKNANLLTQNTLPLFLKLIKIFRENNMYFERREIPIILVWDNNDANALFEIIIKFRNSLPKKISKKNYNQKILDFCIDLTKDEKVSEGKPLIFGTRTKDTTLIIEYPSTFRNYMSMSNLAIKKVYNGRSVYTYDEKQSKLIDYIIDEYLDNPHKEDFESYFSFISTLDPKLYDDFIVESYVDQSQLKKWCNYFEWERIKEYLLRLSENLSNTRFNDDNMVDTPSLALEWLVSLALKSKIKSSYKINPRYHVDSEGRPTRHADGERNNNSGVDALILNQNKFFTLEPTLLTGTNQYYKESLSNYRHLKNELKYQVKQNKSYGICLQISPNPDPDTIEFALFENNRSKEIMMIPISIKQYIDILEESDSMDSFIENYLNNYSTIEDHRGFLN